MSPRTADQEGLRLQPSALVTGLCEMACQGIRSHALLPQATR